MKFTQRQLGTVLAALRYWQRKRSHSIEYDPEHASQANAEEGIATDEGDFDALSPDEIDVLCQFINRPGNIKAEKMKEQPREVTLNAEQELYVIPCSAGYSCLGFDVLLRRANAVAKWLRANGQKEIEDIPAELRGTLDAYKLYSEIMGMGMHFNRITGKRCDTELTPQLIGLEGKRVEVVDAYGDTRRFNVGKSTGWLPCHLEIARRGASGGPAAMGTPYKSYRVVG